MSKLYEYWENHKSKYQGQITSLVSSDLLSLMGRISLNNKKTNISGRVKVNSDENTGSLTGITDFSLSHTCCPRAKYTLSQKGTVTTLDSIIQLYNAPKQSLALYSLLNCDMGPKSGCCSAKAQLRYDYNNHTVVSAGIEEYDHSKTIAPNLFTIYGLHGRNLDNGMNIYGGIYAGYLIKEKALKFQQFLLSVKNGFFTTVLNFSLKKDASQISSSEPKGFDKNISLIITSNLSNNLVVGGDTDFKINNNKLTNRLFTNYQLDSDTIIKSKWEDNDKSVTLTLNHDYRGILSFGVTGKFNVIKNEDSSCKCPCPKIKTKLGFSLEVNEKLI